LGEEWELKLSGFNEEFKKLIDAGVIDSNSKALCLGARTGQEVVSLKGFGIDAIGIDLVECLPHVIEGDIHDLKFNDESFDFIFSNIIDHTIKPEKMVSEAERVLNPGGFIFLQVQVGINQDEFTEYFPESTEDIIGLFKNSECLIANWIYGDKGINSHGMNFEFLFKKPNLNNGLQ